MVRHIREYSHKGKERLENFIFIKQPIMDEEAEDNLIIMRMGEHWAVCSLPSVKCKSEKLDEVQGALTMLSP